MENKKNINELNIVDEISSDDLDENLLSEELEIAKKKERTKKIVKELFSWLFYIALAICISFFITTYITQKTEVDGRSMNPTFQDEDKLMLDKISYKFSDPKRFDVVVFPYPQNESEYFIKRVIGLPGETIQIKEDGFVYINDKQLKEPLKLEKCNYSGIALNPLSLGKDEYFVMGDNRNNSKDSRFEEVGPIKRNKIEGKIYFRLKPNTQIISNPGK